MGKWLSIEEIENAPEELNRNNVIIKYFREQVQNLQYRNQKLKKALRYRQIDEENGNYYTKTFCFEKYGKQYKELSIEEKKDFLRIIKKKSREKLGKN